MCCRSNGTLQVSRVSDQVSLFSFLNDNHRGVLEFLLHIYKRLAGRFIFGHRVKYELIEPFVFLDMAIWLQVMSLKTMLFKNEQSHVA